MMTSSERLLVSICFLLGLCTTVVHKVIGVEPIITTVAGGGSGDGYPAVASTYNRPIRCVCAPDGSIYFSEDGRRRVCKIDGATGILSTYAGNGQPGDGGIGGPAVDANLEDPNSLALDAAGNLYVTDRGTADADIGNHRVCRIDAVTGIITVVAGNGSMGSTGDGGPANEATFNWPTGIAFDSSGNLYICDQRNHRIRRVDTVSGIITTVAGSGVYGSAGDNGPATSARLSDPNAIAVDSAGNMYITDEGNHRVRKVDVGTNIITTVAGTIFGFSGDGGPATAARLYYPGDIAIDAGDNIYIADAQNHRIRMISGGIITTIAGNGLHPYSSLGTVGDGGPATDASLSDLWSIAVTKDGSGDLVFADYGKRRIRRISLSPNQISTVAGGGHLTSVPANAVRTATLSDVVLDSAGNWFLADGGTRKIYRVDTVTGLMTTVAGAGEAISNGDGGQGEDANFMGTTSLALDGLGHLYVADGPAHRIRQIDLTSGVIIAYAGDGTAGFAGDGASALDAKLNGPKGLACDANGNLYFVDLNNQRVRRIDRLSGNITTIAGDGTSVASGDGGPADAAGLLSPSDLAFTSSGNLLIAGDGIRSVALTSTSFISTITNAVTCRTIAIDPNGNLFISSSSGSRIERVAADTHTVSSVAGTGVYGYWGDGGPAVDATIANPGGLAFTAEGSLLLADNINGLRKISHVDAAIPTVIITSPVSESIVRGTTAAYATLGTASDDVSVTSLTYAVSGATTASGSLTLSSGNWSLTTPTLNPGSNTIVITASDRAGNTATDILQIDVDTTSPVIELTSPTTLSTYETDSALVTLSGTASDNFTLSDVTYTLSGATTATGPTTFGGGTWSTSHTLNVGVTIVTVTAVDTAGNSASETLTVTKSSAGGSGGGGGCGFGSGAATLLSLLTAGLFMLRLRRSVT